jgi:hypothetical protein
VISCCTCISISDGFEVLQVNHLIIKSRDAAAGGSESKLPLVRIKVK